MEIPYLEYCGLSETPFGLTPDPTFYVETPSFRAATDHLRFFLDHKEGFALVYGDVGLGKTTISRIFLDDLDKEFYHTALILNPMMREYDFLRQLLRELAVPVKSRSSEKLLENLRYFLLDAHKHGKQTVVVVDEAQLPSSQLFEFMRVLSNFETHKQKLLHIILFAQPEVIQRLSEPGMRYLAQRITLIYRLAPFTRNEVSAYINHRLLRAGSRGFVQFTDGAIKKIYHASKGCPRVINVLGDRCLLYLYSHSKHSVDTASVRAVLKEESQILMQKSTSNRGYTAWNYRRSVCVVAACVAVCLLAVVSEPYFDHIYRLFLRP